ncbi:MAG TPA: pilus assembly protein TadG-related protein [Caulobacteraceae bacterium]|nr:pilus assembly protein TadG-related protein [Caulobacteraceae bacterium]
MKFWDNKGNIAVMAALTAPLLVGGAGLGVETGYWYYEQLRLQQAADAAAYAAALEHLAGFEDKMEPRAETAAALNGFDSPENVHIYWPSQAYPADERTVDVELVHYVPRAFSAVFGEDVVTIRAKATAKYDPSSNACLLALSTSAPGAIYISGNGAMNITGCVVSSNSISPTSINAQGSSMSSMPCMSTAGGVSLNANVTLTSCDAPITGLPPVADPYDSVPLPTPGACKNWPGSGNHTPGTYCGNIPGIHNRIHTFAAGTYIFDGADLAVNGSMGGGMSCPDGCTFVFMNGASVSMNGNPTIAIAAPTAGTYAGMLFMGDDSVEDFTFNGNPSSSTMTGVIYFPAGNVQYNGSFTGFNGCTQVVANTITWTGNTQLSVDCSAQGMSVIQIGGRPYLVG